VPFVAREQVCALIRHHQVPFHLIDRADVRRKAIEVSQTARGATGDRPGLHRLSAGAGAAAHVARAPLLPGPARSARRASGPFTVTPAPGSGGSGRPGHTPSFWIDARNNSDEHYWCFGCLPSGSLIKTANGMRPIEKVLLGDTVYAGDGRLHQVTRLHEHAFSGELIRIVCAPFKVPILLTPDHRVLVLRPRSGKMEEIPARELRAHNYLLYPAIERLAEPLSWAVRDGWTQQRGIRPCPLPVSVDVVAFAEWLGWYPAEGSTSSGRAVQLSLASHELGHAERLRELTQAPFGKELKQVVRGHRLEMWFCHALLAKWLKHHCGRDARHKRLPPFVWTWTTAEQWSLFHALMLGDGYQPAGTQLFQGRVLSRNWSIGLASPTLIDDIRDLLLVNGIVPSSVREHRNKDGRIQWCLELPCKAQELWGRPRIAEIPVRVRHVQRVPYAGPVHNLTVADEHTYLTFSGTVCNCTAHGDVLTFVMEREGCSSREACERLSTRGRPPVVDPSPRTSPKSTGRRWADGWLPLPEPGQVFEPSRWEAPACLGGREVLPSAPSRPGPERRPLSGHRSPTSTRTPRSCSFGRLAEC
jgi:hypothetical protein